MENAILTVKEAAAILRISPSKTYELIRDNQIPHIKLGGRCIVPREPLLNWVAGATRGGIRS